MATASHTDIMIVLTKQAVRIHDLEDELAGVREANEKLVEVLKAEIAQLKLPDVPPVLPI